MSQPSSPLHRQAAAPSPGPRQLALQNQHYYPPNLSPLAAFSSTPCTSLTQEDAAVVLETALLWVSPGRSHAVVHAGAVAMQNACARLLAIDHGHMENLFSDANSLKLFSTRLRTIQHNIRDPSNHAIAVEVATAGCFVAQSRNGALALTSLGLPGVCLNLLESQVEEVQLASCRLLLALADVCQSIRHCLWEAGAVPSLSRLAPRTQNPIIAATALDTLRAIFDDALSRALFCCDQGWEGAVREVLAPPSYLRLQGEISNIIQVMLHSTSPVVLVAASRVVVTAAPDAHSFHRMLSICMPEAIVRMSARVVDDAVIAAGADALFAMGKRGRLVSVQLLNFNLVHPMADALGQVSHWGSKLAICRALAVLCADVPFAQSLFRSTGLATVINVIRCVSTTSSHNAFPPAAAAFGAPSSPLKTAKQTPSLSGSGRVVGEVPHSPSIERRSDFLLPTTPWLSSSVRLGTAEARGASRGVIHSMAPATELLSNDGSHEGMLPVFASTAACDLLLKVATCYDASSAFDPASLFNMRVSIAPSTPFAAHAAHASGGADVEVHSGAIDKLVLTDDDGANSAAATLQPAPSDHVKDTATSSEGVSCNVPPGANVSEVKSSETNAAEPQSEGSGNARPRSRAVQFPAPVQLPTPSPDFAQSMLLRSRLADAGAISALCTALKLTTSVEKKDTSHELARAMEFLQERAAAALAGMCKSSRVCRLYINNAAAVDVCSNVMLKTRRDATLHAIVLVMSCMFGAVSYTDAWWCDWLATADLHAVQRWLPQCFRESPLPHDPMLLCEGASHVAAEDVVWAARSATFALLPLGWLPFFHADFPSKLHEVLECIANGREGSNLAVTPSQEDVLSATGAERSAARVNHQLQLQELASAISAAKPLYKRHSVFDALAWSQSSSGHVVQSDTKCLQHFGRSMYE